MNSIYSYIQSNKGRFIAELQAFCRIPSVTLDRESIKCASDFIISKFQQLGVQYQIYQQENGNPIVIGSHHANHDRRLIFYNHYDVQPPDPIDEWSYPPFGATITDDGRMVCRGVADNKANLLARIFALEAMLATGTHISTNLIFLIEGEEENGSPHLLNFVRTHKKELKGDGAIWEAGEIRDDGHPYLKLGQKGMLYVELQLRTMRTDLHSMWAPVIDNPGLKLMHLLMSLWQENPNSSRIAIPDFYNNLIEPTSQDLKLLYALPFPEQDYLDKFGMTSFKNHLHSEKLKEAMFYQPSINLSGFSTGYGGPGTKTVLPAFARVLLDIRLIPYQNAHEIFTKLCDYIGTIEGLEINLCHAHNPAYTSPDTRIVNVLRKASKETFGKEAIIQPWSQGSGPMWIFTDELGIPTVEGVGCGHPGRNIHAPDENIYIDNFLLSIQQVANIMEIF